MIDIKYIYKIMAFCLAMMAFVSALPVSNNVLILFVFIFLLCSFFIWYFGFHNFNVNFNKNKLFLVLLLYVTMLSSFKFFLYDDLYIFLTTVLSLMICFSMLVAIEERYKSEFVELFLKTVFVFGGILLALMLAFGNLAQGGFVLENAPASFMVPYTFYYTLKAESKIKVFLMIAFVFSVSILLESRTSQVLMICLIFHQVLTAFGYKRFYSVLNYSLVCVVFSASIIAYNNEYLFYILNDILTNRLIIWYFYIGGVDDFLFGSSISYKEMSSLVSGFLSSELDRGVAEHYGTHSSLVKYFFDFGFIGFILFLVSALYIVFRYSYSIFTTYLLSIILLTSTMVGQANLFGIMLSLIFLGAFSYDE